MKFRVARAQGQCAACAVHASCPLASLKSSASTLLQTSIMKVSFGLVSSLLLSGASIVSAAAWSFEDATVAIASKGAGVGGAAKDK